MRLTGTQCNIRFSEKINILFNYLSSRCQTLAVIINAVSSSLCRQESINMGKINVSLKLSILQQASILRSAANPIKTKIVQWWGFDVRGKTLPLVVKFTHAINTCLLRRTKRFFFRYKMFIQPMLFMLLLSIQGGFWTKLY